MAKDLVMNYAGIALLKSVRSSFSMNIHPKTETERRELIRIARNKGLRIIRDGCDDIRWTQVKNSKFGPEITIHD